MTQALQTTFGSLLSALQAMTPGSFLLALALAMATALLVFRPVLAPRRAAPRPASRREQLEVQKAALLAEIRDLDFDQETEKVAPEAYSQRRAQLVTQAADILRQIDRLPGDNDSLDARIEMAVALRRRTTVTPVETHPAPMPAAGISAENTPAPARVVNFCPQCGQRATPQDRFCAACGHQLV